MRRMSDEALAALLTVALGAYSLLLAGECIGIWHILPRANGQDIQTPHPGNRK